MKKEEAIFCEKSYLGETNCIDCNYYGTDICKSRESHKMAIKALEQQPKTEWVPVSERLPKENRAVLIWCPERKNIYCACYEEKHWWIYGAYFKKIEEDVIAWQPLPKPYESEGE